jgi:nicotinate-nucleotide adenylyltransferase
MTPLLRVGVYGGSFDPPHMAHTALAQAAVTQLGLDVLHIVPTGQAWHKTRTLSATAHRLAMTRLAFEGMPGVVVDAQEIEREGPSYTIDTLAALKQRYPEARLYLLLGQDQARALNTWKRSEDIAQNAIICIADRASNTRANGIIEPENSAASQAQRISMPAMPHSSTDIRARVALGQRIEHLVAPAVARYIATNQLYTQHPAREP